MIDEDRGKDSSTNQLKSRSNSIRAYVSDLICRASEEEDFDARKILEENPEVQNYRSLVLDLAYEEYCQKVESGDDIKQQSFAKRFPEFEESLLRVLQVHQYLEKTESPKSKPKVEWPKPGDVFGEYRLLELIGRGTFAFVYIAEQLNVAGRKVVLKITRDALDEVETLGRLDHPNIVQIFTVESNVDGFTAICMPLISQVTLFDLLAELHGGGVQPQSSVDFADALQACLNERQDASVDRENLPFRLNGPFVEAVIRVGIDIANALTYSHERGFLHCDIKPTNILISPNGRSMLFDFNLSAKSNSKTGRIGGTLPYMPPEQLQALIDNDYDFEATRAVDMFAFGVTLYQFLTGKLPFGDIPETATQKEAAKILLERQQTTKISFEGVKGLNRSLKQIIEQCLEFKHQHRPKTAEKVAQQLEAENSRIKRTRRWVITNPLKTMVAVLLVVVSIAGAVYGFNYLNNRPNQKISEFFEKGIAAEKENSFDDAVYYFTKAMQNSTESSQNRFKALCHLSVVFARYGKHDDAIRMLTQIKQEFPEHSRIAASIELAILICVPTMSHDVFMDGWSIHDRNSRTDEVPNLNDMSNYAALMFRHQTTNRVTVKTGLFTPPPDLEHVLIQLNQVLDLDPNHAYANLNKFHVLRKQAIYKKKEISEFGCLDKACESMEDNPKLLMNLFLKEKAAITIGGNGDNFRKLLDRFVACRGPVLAAREAIRGISNEEIKQEMLSVAFNMKHKECDIDLFEYFGVANPLASHQPLP